VPCGQKSIKHLDKLPVKLPVKRYLTSSSISAATGLDCLLAKLSQCRDTVQQVQQVQYSNDLLLSSDGCLPD
jgi:hypothetical protein